MNKDIGRIIEDQMPAFLNDSNTNYLMDGGKNST